MARAIKLINAPVGLFDIDGELVLKTEYSTQHEDGAITPDCYIVGSGEYFWGGVDSVEERNNLMVTPIDISTLTPPTEWVSVETPPTTQGWYHVAVLDLKTGKYTVEQDLYSIELAKAYGFEPGFCKANRWEERERIDYWCRFPTPPNRRPPEGEA